MAPRLGYVIVLSDEDPVARAVRPLLGTPPVVDHEADGSSLRTLAPGVGLLHRPGLHIHDEDLHVRSSEASGVPPTLVFPSVHRSAANRETLTVHPLGNPGDSAEVGGRPRALVPTDPRRMTDALRRVRELGDRIGWPSTFEATHHGPSLAQPAFFVEIGAADYTNPPETAVRGFAQLLRELNSDPRDRIAVGLGGGHYAPHFTDLAIERQWAFGHLLPDHALKEGGAALVESAVRSTPEAAGVLYHRARDADQAPWGSSVTRCRDSEAPRRVPEG